jgi:hypothetical protein
MATTIKSKEKTLRVSLKSQSLKMPHGYKITKRVTRKKKK